MGFFRGWLVGTRIAARVVQIYLRDCGGNFLSHESTNMAAVAIMRKSEKSDTESKIY
jgi:hypothetical protein